MGLQPTAGPLVPSWVYEDYFPQADETAMKSLASTWRQQGTSCHTHADDLGTHMATLADSYTGQAADAAADFAQRTRQWLDSTGDACTQVAHMVTRAAEYVTFTKRAINVVLAALQNTTAKVKQQSGGNLATKLIGMVRIRQLQIAAQTQVKALAQAGAERISGLSCDVDISPSMGRPSAKAIAAYAVKTEDVAGHLPPGAAQSGTAPGGTGARNAFDPTVPGMPGPDGQTGTGVPGAPGAPDGTVPAGDRPAGDSPVDPSTIVGGGNQAANAGDAPEEGGGAPDLTGLGSQEAADRAEEGMENPDEGFDFDDGDLGEAGSDVDPDAAAATMNGAGGPGAPGAPGGPGGGSTLTDTADTGGPDGSGPSGGPDAPGGYDGHGGHDGGETLTPVDGSGAPAGAGEPAGGGGPSYLHPGDGGASGHSSSWDDSSWHETRSHDAPWHDTSSTPPSTASPAPSAPAPTAGTHPSYPTHGYPTHDVPTPDASTHHVSTHGAPIHHSAPSYEQASQPSGPVQHDAAPASSGGGDTSVPTGGRPIVPHHDPGTTAAGVAPPPAPSAPAGTGIPQAAAGPAPAPTGQAPAPAAPSAPAGGPPAAGSSFSGSAMSGAPTGAAPTAPAPTGPAPSGAAPPPTTAPTQPAPHAAPAPRPQPAPVQTGTTGAPVSSTGNVPPGSPPPGGAPPTASTHQTPGQRRDLPDARPPTPDVDRGAGDSAASLLVGGLLGGAGGAVLVWGDLGRPAAPPPAAAGPYGGTIWATQFGPGDEITAALPPGMGIAYQQVLLPGATDRLLTGRQTTVRGLIHPLDQVRHLDRPADLHAALGLGFPLLDEHGSSELAAPSDIDHLDVLRFQGIRDEDLVVPVEADVVPPDSPPIPWVVRHHERPWTGSGEAPGSLSTALIEEFELLAEAAVGIPHLAEIWRMHDDGRIEHVSTFNARTGVWTGDRTVPAPAGTPVANGLHALTRRSGPAAATAINEHEHVLAEPPDPDDPEAAEQAGQDGLCRRTVDNDRLTGMVGIATVAHWHGARVRLLRRDGDRSLVDYAGGDRAEAVRLGLRQLDQAQWEPQWVPAAEVQHRTRLQRPYPLPEPAPDVAEAIG